MTNSKIGRIEKTLLLVWFLIGLGLVAMTVHAHGMSTDEPNNYRYAADTLAAYPSVFGLRYEPKLDSSYHGHGPAFVAIAAIPISTVQWLFPAVFAPDLWHFSYFVTFLLAGLCLYWLARRWFQAWTTWGLLLLFSTQPLLLGHAFMNPKDMPFLFFFTLSIVLGFRLVDGLEGEESRVTLAGPAQRLADQFQRSDPRRKRKFLISLTLGVVLALLLILFTRQVDSVVGQVVVYFYTASPDTWAGRLFSSVATQASNVPIEEYTAKTLKLFQRVETLLLMAGLLFFLLYASLVIRNQGLPEFLHSLWMQLRKLTSSFMAWLGSIGEHLRPSFLKSWLLEFLGAFRNPRLWIAGAALGFATAVRAVAPLAGVIVVFYLLLKIRSKAWGMAAAYFLIAGIVTYIAWPYLWSAPIRHYLEELGIVSNFQFYAGRVLFNGEFYGIRDLPRSYLPALLSIQFTEPLVFCIYFGIGILIWQLVHGSLRADLLLYIGLGFFLPLAGLILLNSPLYHNFRQALFIVPAMVLLAAFTLELIFSKLVKNWARLLLIVIFMLPGLYATVRLYPYEYVYYNALVGGTAGARDRYEMDYWRTAMREAALGINEIAPPGAKIVIGGSAALFNRYAKPGLVVETVNQHTYDLNGGYDYAVQLARWQKWELYPQAKIEILIERNGAVLATVRAVKNAQK